MDFETRLKDCEFYKVPNHDLYYNIDEISYDEPYQFRLEIYRKQDEIPELVHTDHFIKITNATAFINNLKIDKLFCYENYCDGIVNHKQFDKTDYDEINTLLENQEDSGLVFYGPNRIEYDVNCTRHHIIFTPSKDIPKDTTILQRKLKRLKTKLLKMYND